MKSLVIVALAQRRSKGPLKMQKMTGTRKQCQKRLRLHTLTAIWN